MIKECTFGIYSYNEEKYIIENLESIKYQIEQYLKGVEVYLIINDDCSTDRTIEYIEKWIEDNGFLFKNVKINKQMINVGISRNYVDLVNSIETDNFVLIAGDDLFYKNNVFEIDGEFVITPAIKFDAHGVFFNEWRDYYNLYVGKNEKELNRLLKKQFKYTFPIETPSFFWKKKLLDENTLERVLNFKYINDIPLIEGLLRNTKHPVFNEKVYVLWRQSSGISTNKNTPFRKEYEKERELIDLKYRNSLYNKSKFYKEIVKRYEYYLTKLYQKMPMFSTKIRKYNDNYLKELEEAEKYYSFIKKEAIKYK